MSDNNNKDTFFSNQDTIVRRAWINSALDGVRSRLQSGSEQDAVTANIAISEEQPSSEASAAPQRSAPKGSPRLYVAWSSETRRSGT